MNNDIVSRFQKKHESLAGIVHPVGFHITESSGCKIQLQEGTGLKVWHPLELL